MPRDVQYLRTVYREYEINALVDLEQKLCSCCSWSWDLKYIGLMTNLGPVPFVPWGTSRRVRRSKNIHNEKASTFHETLEVGVKDADTLFTSCTVLYGIILRPTILILKVMCVSL